MLNHVLAINILKNDSKFDPEFLDIYSKEQEDQILLELISEDLDSFYQDDESEQADSGHSKEVYGAYKWLKKNTKIREWLKFMACQTKEPSFTQFTSFKGCCDYIFYQGEGINVARVLDIPAYNRFLKDNIHSLPHSLMPSDHLSVVADFYIQSS